VRRGLLFHDDDDDYLLFTNLVARVRSDLGWNCRIYCLVPNHYHLVLETPEPNLSRGMHRLNGRYAQLYNERYETSGHVFQGRFWSDVIETDDYYEEVCRYVYDNPEAAGLCTSAEWPWLGGDLVSGGHVRGLAPDTP
jgi:putative transposase